MVEGGGDVVDRHEVGVAEVDPDQRQPCGKGVAQQLEDREQEVGTVDLVHRAGLAVADHDRRPVDPPRHRGLLAHELLGEELRAVVRRGQGLVLVEHRLVERTVVLPGDGDRADLVEAADLQRPGELERVAGAADVHDLVGLVVRGHVVDRGQMEEVVDVAAVLVHPRVVDPEPLGGQLADDGHHPLGVPELDHRLEPGQRALADEDEDRPLAVLEQLLDEMSPDEPGGARDEVRHGRDPTRRKCRRQRAARGQRAHRSSAVHPGVGPVQCVLDRVGPDVPRPRREHENTCRPGRCSRCAGRRPARRRRSPSRRSRPCPRRPPFVHDRGVRRCAVRGEPHGHVADRCHARLHRRRERGPRRQHGDPRGRHPLGQAVLHRELRPDHRGTVDALRGSAGLHAGRQRVDRLPQGRRGRRHVRPRHRPDHLCHRSRRAAGRLRPG